MVDLGVVTLVRPVKPKEEEGKPWWRFFLGFWWRMDVNLVTAYETSEALATKARFSKLLDPIFVVSHDMSNNILHVLLYRGKYIHRMQRWAGHARRINSKNS